MTNKVLGIILIIVGALVLFLVIAQFTTKSKLVASSDGSLELRNYILGIGSSRAVSNNPATPATDTPAE